MRRCPACGCDLTLYRRRNTQRVRRWQIKNRAKYNEYMRRYMKGYKARKREAVSQ
jgi:hypothetical protein